MITIRSRGQSCSSTEVIVRRIIGTGSPQQGTMMPTDGSAPRGSGCGSGTVRHQWLKMLSIVVASVKRLAARNGQASHGSPRFSVANNHGI